MLAASALLVNIQILFGLAVASASVRRAMIKFYVALSLPFLISPSILTADYASWATRYSEAIQATSAIVSTVGIFIVAASLVVSLRSLKVASKALEESKRATQAQTFFNIQRFGYEVAQDTVADASFWRYRSEGAVPSVDGDAQMRKFGTLLNGYNIIFFQRKFGFIKEPEWALFKQEFRSVMRSKGASHYFAHNPIDSTLFDDEFKDMVRKCRARGGIDVAAL